ncbi:MAG: D-alanyl-D-alanine carboxypeptidase family protein [Oscillatoriales cyanobacterium]|nr:MAG: D-alanyl-D-alanine carboxypeptidase family protein [Oscillatoriales cyanobacterium]
MVHAVGQLVGLSWMVSQILGVGSAIALPIAPILPDLAPPAPVLPTSQLPDLDCSTVSDTSFYGHLPYPEADLADLVSVGSGVSMQRDAAASFEQLRRAAARDGVSLVPLSGFRSIETQIDLFYGVAADRGQTPAQRALVSAPPGHSEHHTGYTVDIGDGLAAWADLNVSFASTDAGRWLAANAASFGFELSFPPEHACVSYEPWHWRWVGDDRSRAIFETARRYDAQAGIDRESSESVPGSNPLTR